MLAAIIVCRGRWRSYINEVNKKTFFKNLLHCHAQCNWGAMPPALENQVMNWQGGWLSLHKESELMRGLGSFPGIYRQDTALWQGAQVTHAYGHPGSLAYSRCASRTKLWLSGSMTMICALWSQIIRQKSFVVCGRGCWVIMNSLLL